jgi:HEAT repeat protein
MSVLTGTAEQSLAEALDRLSSDEASTEAAKIGTLLAHRLPQVRIAAAAALVRAGRGEALLLSRLEKEHNDLVLAELCDSLSGVGTSRALDKLRQLASQHPSQLVRRHALSTLSAIIGPEGTEYLRDRRRRDQSRRVRATIDVLLLGDPVHRAESLDYLRKHAQSKDRIVRSIVAVMPRYNPALRNLPELKGLLRTMQANLDENEGVRGDAASTLRVLWR